MSTSLSWIYIYRFSKVGIDKCWGPNVEDGGDSSRSAVEEEGRDICQKAIRYRLERMNVDASACVHFSTCRKLENPQRTEEAYKKIIDMMDLLVASYPDIYQELSEKLKLDVKDERNLCKTFTTFATELFSNGVSWIMIVAFLTFAGFLAAECVKQGRSIVVRSISDWSAIYIAIKLKPWILENGGWAGVTRHFETSTSGDSDAATRGIIKLFSRLSSTPQMLLKSIGAAMATKIMSNNDDKTSREECSDEEEFDDKRMLKNCLPLYEDSYRRLLDTDDDNVEDIPSSTDVNNNKNNSAEEKRATMEFTDFDLLKFAMSFLAGIVLCFLFKLFIETINNYNR